MRLGYGLPYILLSAVGWHRGWLLPPAVPSPLACAGCLGSYHQVQSSFHGCSLLQVHCLGYSRLSTGEAGAMQTPSPLPKVAVAFCSKHLPLAAMGGGREVVREGRQEAPSLAFLRGRRERGAGV